MLQTTALINEVYVRLVDLCDVTWQDRVHFFAVCARLMRRILTDAALVAAVSEARARWASCFFGRNTGGIPGTSG